METGKRIIEQIVRLEINGDETKAEVVGELVRCKDCKHRDKCDCNNLTFGDIKCCVPDDWFCADGKRKETEKI